MSIKDQLADLAAFANEPPQVVEHELSRLLRGESESIWLEHGSETVARRLRNLVEQTNPTLVGRETDAKVVAAGLISGVSVLLLGPPGTGKSALIRELASRCGMGSVDANGNFGGYFEYLLTNHTMPEEIFGGPDIEALAKGKFKRIIDRKLPCAEIAFLDEVFRGGSHILNTLLTVLNEKRYDSGNGTAHVPLLGVIGASNTPPQDPDLEAFYDRFPVRVWLRSVFDSRDDSESSERETSHKLLNYSTDRERKRLADGWNPEEAKNVRVQNRVSCTNDFRFARTWLLRLLSDVSQNSARFNQFDQLFRSVRERVRLSDRSFGQLWLFGGALDLLAKRNPNDRYPDAEGHLEVFRYVARSLHDEAFLNDRVAQFTRGLEHTGAD